MMDSGGLPSPTWFVEPSLPLWVGPLGLGVTLWAGLELMALTERAKAAALTFSIVTAGIALWGYYDRFSVVGDGVAQMRRIIVGDVFVQAMLVMSLIVPVTVAYLASRRLST